MRHPIRSAVVAGASAVLLTMGAGTASAQGSLGSTTGQFPLDIAGIAALFGFAPNAPAVDELGAAIEHTPAFALPDGVAQRAFEGTVVAGINEARSGMGLERLVTDPRLADDARAAAARTAESPDADEEATPEAAAARAGTEDAENLLRGAVELEPDASPQAAIAALLADPETRDLLFDREGVRTGVGTATGDDGRIHVVMDVDRA